MVFFKYNYFEFWNTNLYLFLMVLLDMQFVRNHIQVTVVNIKSISAGCSFK